MLNDLPLFRPSEKFGQAAQKRAATQLEAVRSLTGPTLSTGVRQWWTLRGLVNVLRACDIHATEAGVSARLRDLRRPQHGGHRVERREKSPGLWEYRVGPPGSEPEPAIHSCPTCHRRMRR